MIKNLEIYCVTNKLVPHIEKTDYKLASVGKDSFPENYIKSDTGDNIFLKRSIIQNLHFITGYGKII